MAKSEYERWWDVNRGADDDKDLGKLPNTEMNRALKALAEERLKRRFAEGVKRVGPCEIDCSGLECLIYPGNKCSNQIAGTECLRSSDGLCPDCDNMSLAKEVAEKYRVNYLDTRDAVRKEEKEYVPYPWQVSDHEYPAGIKLNVAPLEEKDDVGKDGPPQNVVKKHFVSKEDMGKVRFEPLEKVKDMVPQYFDMTIEEDVGYSDKEWEEKKKKYADLMYPMNQIPPGAGRLSGEVGMDYGKQAMDRTVRGSKGVGKWREPAEDISYENDQRTKEIKNLKEIITQQNQIIHEFRYKKTQEEKKLIDDLLHFMGLADEYAKDIALTKKKLHLLETDPEEYHRRKKLDPHDEEIWD